MARVFVVGVVLLICGCGAPSARPAATMKHLVIVSVDGLRPDVLLRANAPHVRSLMRRGSFTMWARSTDVSVTLPTHASMLTGVSPARHDIWWNWDVPEYYFHNPAAPTIFELAKRGGYSTAMAVGKSKFVALNKAGTVDWAYLPDGYAQDFQVAHEAAAIIEKHRPQLLFVHFPHVDATGHGAGWGGEWQMRAMENADRALGAVLAALRRRGMLESTVIIVTADHGGAGKGHGADDPRSRHVPWIIAGPGIRKNFDLTLESELKVNVEDTFATACTLLGLPLDEDLDGKPVMQAMEEAPRGEVIARR